jgi:hypothetical protein
MPYTPKKTVKAIIDSGNDYLIAVKSNQASLYRQVKAIASDCKPRQCAHQFSGDDSSGLDENDSRTLVY